MTAADPDLTRAQMRQRWQSGAAGWGRRADEIQEFGLPVSVWMIEQLRLQPGQRVLELAGGPGDTGFLAAEQVRPGGMVIETDASDAMLGVAKGRARDLGATNVEFRRMELEWLDMPTASVDAILCRWGLMFALDPGAAFQEIRRVLAPGGWLAFAVWDAPEQNPWATIPTRALIELGHVEPPDPTAPGMFTLADPVRLRELLESAGLTEIVVDTVELSRRDSGVEDFLKGTLDLSQPFSEVHDRLTADQWQEVERKVAELASPFVKDGALSFPARTLVGAASA
ncbi:MAG: class I SAM-dependent methyltransferase [Solirubrobacteraceae bacterium]